MTRDVERRRFGLPPGGWRGLPSSSHRASRISSMVTGALRPAGARTQGQEAIADASDAHDARIACFSETESEGGASTSLGRSKENRAGMQYRIDIKNIVVEGGRRPHGLLHS